MEVSLQDLARNDIMGGNESEKSDDIFVNRLIIERLEPQMLEYLQSVGCCSSCCLRLIGVGREGNNIPDSETDPCVACLGILQPKIKEETLQKIDEVIKSSGYDSSTFTCAFSVPASLSLRERSLYIALAQKFELTGCQQLLIKQRSSSVKEIWKGQVIPKIETETFKQVLGSVPSPFTIEVVFTYDDDESECKILLNYFNDKEEEPPVDLEKHSRNNVEKMMAMIIDKAFGYCFPIPPSKSSMFVKIGVRCSHGSIFIGGRYAKLSRRLSQTPWFINGVKKMETSVQDLLGNDIVQYTKADTLKFLSSGREDVDVRTLNSGRPFAVELINPRVTKITSNQCAELVKKINASTKLVQITSELKLLTVPDLKLLKEGENIKTKFYRALCILRTASKDSINLDRLSGMPGLRIIQKTPIRVLHRRPLAPRPRVIHRMRARWLTTAESTKVGDFLEKSNSKKSTADQLFVLDVKTQAGTYIKEFIHGDFGRTRPNLGEILGTEIDIVTLDVTGINIHWP